MTETDTKKFKIDLNAPLNDDVAENAPLSQGPAPDRATRRPMWIIFIAILVMGAVFIWGYHDLRKQLHAVDTTGSTEISVLSTQIEAASETLKELMAEGDAALRTDLARMEAQLKTADAAIADMRTRKAEQSEFKTAFNRTTSDMETLKKNLDGLKQQIDQLTARTESAFAGIEKLQARIEQQQQTIEKLAATAIDNDKLKAALTAEREFAQQNMAHSAETLFSEIAALQKIVKDLKARIDAAARSNADQGPVTRVKPESPRESVGGIIEQEIK